VADQLGRNLPGPFIPKTLIHVIEIPLIPRAQSPTQSLKTFQVAFAFQGNVPD